MLVVRGKEALAAGVAPKTPAPPLLPRFSSLRARFPIPLNPEEVSDDHHTSVAALDDSNIPLDRNALSAHRASARSVYSKRGEQPAAGRAKASGSTHGGRKANGRANGARGFSRPGAARRRSAAADLGRIPRRQARG